MVLTQRLKYASMASSRGRTHAGFDERSRQFADDLKLPFDNALLYNEDTSDVSASARVMLAKCEELIESLRYEEPPEPEEPLLELPPAKKRRFAGRWAEDEEASLKELVAELGDNAWDQVAERLGTGRSARGAEQHWEVMRGTHAFARKRKGPPPKAPPKRSPKKEPEPEPVLSQCPSLNLNLIWWRRWRHTASTPSS